MLTWLAADQPTDLDCVLTSVAPDNRHMLLINEELGFVVDSVAQLVEVSVAEVRLQLHGDG
ncbi:hypothetical protein [Actinoplanes sp. NPDC051859]|uniref:hypothetical protein n=1 Tax=Actinoplanes sp. NPDC051859 TaxID=3363909 RepID=UPI003789CBED